MSLGLIFAILLGVYFASHGELRRQLGDMIALTIVLFLFAAIASFEVADLVMGHSAFGD